MITAAMKSRLDANAPELYRAAKAIADAWTQERLNLPPGLGIRLLEVLSRIERDKP